MFLLLKQLQEKIYAKSYFRTVAIQHMALNKTKFLVIQVLGVEMKNRKEENKFRLRTQLCMSARRHFHMIPLEMLPKENLDKSSYHENIPISFYPLFNSVALFEYIAFCPLQPSALYSFWVVRQAEKLSIFQLYFIFMIYGPTSAYLVMWTIFLPAYQTRNYANIIFNQIDVTASPCARRCLSIMRREKRRNLFHPIYNKSSDEILTLVFNVRDIENFVISSQHLKQTDGLKTRKRTFL
ncbi:hypothetical protein GQX74_006199 [Glossina fuscipes]|nr:hypothetical protein GQX74_006199 [Glossina fuscipes]